jgi:RNA polymerase sigma-70 factor (ECF subfamily)
LRRHYDNVYVLCRRMTGNDADAHDATQEALLAVCRGLPRFDGRSAFATWAYRVATNACLDELRRRARRPAPVDELPTAVGAGAPFAGVADPVDTVDAVAHRIDVDAALAQLPPEYRAVIVLRELLGLDYAEIAAVLGVPGGTVRSRLARGRAALARLLGNQPDPGSRPTPQP